MSNSSPIKETTEASRILMIQAAIEVSGREDIVLLPHPLPQSRRQYLYPDIDTSNSDTNHLGKNIGVPKLFSVLSETKTPHLVDLGKESDRKDNRRGLCYIDNEKPIPEQLLPFVTEDARRAWKSFTTEKQNEVNALQQAAVIASQHTSVKAMTEAFPEEKNKTDSQNLNEGNKNPIYTSNKRTSTER
jgi:hypothetical protein